MPSKKKKFNARFPPARIKKIMQTDEDVGKVAAAVPVIISRALELFIQSLIVKASETTRAKHAKTLSSSHIKQTIQSEKQFDFLKDLVASIPDVAPADEDNSDVHVPPSSSSVPAIVPERVVSATTPRPRGRPRKKPAEGDEVPKIPKKRGRKPKAAVAAALAAQPTMTASSEHDSSDSSDDEAEPANHSEMPTLPSSQHTHASASTPPRLTPEPSCHNLQPPPHVSLSTGQSLPSSPAPPVMPPPPASSSAISPSHVPFPTTSSTSRTPTSMPHETNILVPSSISHSTSSSSTAPPPVQLTSMPASSLALPPPIRGAIPTPSAMPHTLPPYAQMPRTSEMPMNLSAPTSHIPHPAFYHPSSYQASTSGVLDLSKSAQPPSDSAAAASTQPPMFAMPPGGGRFPHYPMLPGYSQHMGLPPMLTRPPLISSMMASSSKPSGTPGEMPPAFPQPPFAGFPPRPRPSASEDYDS